MVDKETSPDRRSPMDRFLGLFSDVRGGEAPTVLLMLSSVFLLLVAYYVLKNVREPLVLAYGAADLEIIKNKDWPEWIKESLQGQGGPQLKAVAAACQALLLTLFVPFYSWIASRVNRVKLIVTVTLFFIVNLELFYLAARAKVPFLGFYFYIWVGIFSVAMIAQFWSFANDLYRKEAGERLFPIIAIGAAAGPPISSKVTGWLFGLQLPVFVFMQIPAVILGAYLVLTLVVNWRERAKVTGKKAEAEDKITGANGFALVLRSPYVRLVALLMVLLNLVNTTGEFILSDYVVAQGNAAIAADPTLRLGDFIGGFYSDFNLYVSVITLVLQALVVSRIVKYLGLRGVVLVLPIVALGAYGLIAAGAGFAVLRWAKTAENATDYSIMNTGKALLWLPTTRAEKYKAKQAVDTFFVRIGDLVAAVLFVTATGVFHLQLRLLGLVNLALVAGWLGVTFLVLRRHAKLTEKVDPKSSTD